MTTIELIGLRTAMYDDIRAHLISFIEINKLKIDVVETNDLKKILESNFLSIPLISLGTEKLYFNDNEISTSLQKVKVFLSKFKEAKSHSCKNCGNCKCPTDKIN